MLYMWFGEYWQYYLLGIILLPGIILAAWAQARVKTTYSKYSKVMASRGLTGAEVAKRILETKGIYDVQVVQSKEGHLSDNYNPKTKKIALSSEVYYGTDVAAIGVAAHECGHAIQHAEAYAPLKIRRVLVAVSNVTSQFLWPLVVIGIIFNFAYVGGVWGDVFMWAGVAFFGISIIFSLITLPVEYNASSRALNMLVSTGVVDDIEVRGTKKVLSAAALTYVAALIVSILSLLRFVIFFLLNSRKDD